jgi:hypothetical protein
MVIALITSVTVAVLSSAIAWRLYRLERLRSIARLSALSAAIDEDRSSATEEFAWEEPPLLKDDAPGLFSQAQQPVRSRGVLMTAAATMGLGILVVVLMAMLADGERPIAESARPTAEGEHSIVGGGRPNAATQAHATDALELLSMMHARDGSALVVTGLVRNASATSTSPLTTVVTALDADGVVVGTSSAALAAVGPGMTEPFTVRLDGISAVGRYRVSFRTNSGVMPHVDRRGANPAPRAAAE